MLFCAAALTLAACTNDLKETAQVSTRPSVTFEGGFAGADTKTAFTDADAASDKLVWSKDDAIGIFTVIGDETENVNCRADLLRSSIGSANGVFIPEESTSEDFVGLTIPEKTTETFLIYYPFSSKTDINVDDFKIHSAVAAEQTQAAVNDQEIGKNGFAYAFSTVEPEAKKVNFTLTHALAYVRFVVSTSDYAEYMLKSVQIYDADATAVIAGDYAFNVESKAVEVSETAAGHSAKISLSDDAAFQAIGTGKQELYLTLLPGADLTSAKMYVVVTFINQKGETVSIPMELKNKGVLKAATMSTIDLGSVNASSNTFAWYQPVEKRNLVGGWCYGAQNTYFVQRSETADTWTPITFEVKARGDFSQVAEPKYVGIISSGDVGNNGLIRLSDGTMAYNSKPTTEVSSSYEVTVEMAPDSKNCGSSAYGVISIYDASYNLLWSYMINSYLAGEEPMSNDYPQIGKSVMDRNLGAKRPATKEAIPEKGTWGAYFQWGRPTPLMWSNSGQTHYIGAFVTEDTDLKAALAKPYIKWGATKGDSWSSGGKWYVGETRNLWGCNNSEDGNFDTTTDMGKTVYDPCPAGYRVISGDVIDYAVKYGVRNEIEHTDITATADILFAGVASVVQIPLGNDKYDYWIYNGAHWGSTASWGNRASSTNKHAAIYWSNSPVGGNAYCLEHCYFSAGYGGADGDKDGKQTFTGNQAHGFSVRCMVDTDNR